MSKQDFCQELLDHLESIHPTKVPKVTALEETRLRTLITSGQHYSVRIIDNYKDNWGKILVTGPNGETEYYHNLLMPDFLFRTE